MEEIWKDIYEYDGIDYQGKYQVSNYGNIRSNDYIIHSTRKQTYLKEGRDIKSFYSCKYMRTKLCINGKVIQRRFIDWLQLILFQIQIQMCSLR